MKKKIIQIVLSLIVFLIALLVPFSRLWINYLLFFISYLIVGAEVVFEAFKHILKGLFFDETYLMSIATLGAFAIGEFPEAVTVMLLYQIGETLQDYATDKSRKSITSLMDIRPDFANVKRKSKFVKVSPNEVNIGDIIMVRPGEKIPLDGKVVKGSSLLDTSSLTGESVPRSVSSGDVVLSGCINSSSTLTIKVTKNFGESTVSKILDLVENASSKKSKAENFITKFAKYYTPAVVLIALALAFVPSFVFHWGIFAEWCYRALTFLVVSCPCSLVISIPLGFFAGIGGAAKIGVLVKGGNYLEILANTNTVVFDKTGTLTEGTFEVQEIHPIGISEDELLKIAAYSENYSTHPISLSLKKAYGKDIDDSLVSDIKEFSGLGIMSTFDNKDVLIGNEKLMQKYNIDFNKCEKTGTILYIAIDNKFVGHILISDKLKSDAVKAIKSLRKCNVKKIVMLTGDKKSVADDIAKQLDIDEVYSELLPNDKAEKLQKIINHLNNSTTSQNPKSSSSSKKGKNAKLSIKKRNNVAFVGDGINDSPVLALADVGIAMGAIGSDSAIEAADIVIMTDEPSKLSDSIKLSRKTMKIIKQNIIFSLIVKFIVLLLSAFGLSTMWEAVFADVGVCIISILNSLRALHISK